MMNIRQYNNNKHCLTLLFLFLLWLSLPVQAQSDYRVEVILFEHLYPETGGEQWVKFPGLPDTGGAIDINGVEAGSGAYQALEESQLTLAGAYSAIQNSSRYQPMRYLAWQQPQKNSEQADSVKVSASSDNGSQSLLGYVRIRSSTYLHVDLDLAYYLDGGPGDFVRSQSRVSRMQESRRIKLNEIHYFDHPLFGVIVRVVRL